MTDTPRTQAELLSIFADQQDHGITAQDMRDLVVSTMGDHIGEASVFAIDASMTPVADGASVPWKVHTGADPSQTHVYDPLGVLESGSDYVSTFDGLTHEAGSWWSLGAGLWLVKAQVVWSTASSAGVRYLTAAPIDNRQDTPDLDHLFWNPGYQSGILTGLDNTQAGSLVNANGFGGGMQVVTGVYRVPEALAPVAFAGSVYQDSGGPLALVSGNILVQRLAG